MSIWRFVLSLILVIDLVACTSISAPPIRESGARSGGPTLVQPLVALPSNPPPQVVEFAFPDGSADQSTAITAGYDRNIWVGLAYQCAPTCIYSIARYAMDGSFTKFSLPSGSSVAKMVRGPQGKIWFTESDVGKIGTIDSSGKIVEYSLRISTSGPEGIAFGIDGNAWFTETATNKIGKITPTGVITEFNVPTQPPPGLPDITDGPDGNLWFTEINAGKIGRISTAGAFKEFVVGGYPASIVKGADHNLWFDDYVDNQVGRLTLAGVVTKIQIPTANSGAGNIILGPNGSTDLWFPEGSCSADNLASVTTSGTITEHPFPVKGACPGVLSAGPDGNLWLASNYPRAVEIYVLAPIDTTPQSISVAPGQSQLLTVSESGYSNTFTATSSNNAIAAVAPGSSPDSFLIKGVSTGSCIILMADKRGNSVPVSTTVN